MVRSKLDRTDLKILAEIQRDGRISMVELARRVHLTKTPCAERLKRMEQDGVIEGYFARISPKAVGAGHVVMVQVQLRGTTAPELDAFNAAVRRVPQIQSCHMIAGGYDYLLKVRSRDIEDYRLSLGDTISKLPGVQQTHTYVVMETVKDAPTVVIDASAHQAE